MQPDSPAVLARRTLTGFAQLMIALALLLMAPAWTLSYWHAWLYIAVFAIATILITLHLWTTDRTLLQRRVDAGPSAETQKGQKVIQAVAGTAFIGLMAVPSIDHRLGWSNVPISVVRHPMYLGGLILLLGTPLGLGSWWGLLLMIPMTLVLIWRLLDEERFLNSSLPGYREYTRQVRHRLIPGVW